MEFEISDGVQRHSFWDTLYSISPLSPIMAIIASFNWTHLSRCSCIWPRYRGRVFLHPKQVPKGEKSGFTPPTPTFESTLLISWIFTCRFDHRMAHLAAAERIWLHLPLTCFIQYKRASEQLSCPLSFGPFVKNGLCNTRVQPSNFQACLLPRTLP
jgi:hypothetical protein